MRPTAPGPLTASSGAPPASPAPISVTVAPGLRVHAVQTGWVRVKAAHRAWAGPPTLRTLAVALDPRWTEWLPITAWVVEHPEGVLLVDVGETPQVAAAGYFACDPGTRWVYEHLLRFAVPPAAALGAQLARLGVPGAAVRWVALTHLHSDHAGGLGDVGPGAAVLVAKREFDGPRRGALPCRWPAGFRPRLVDYAPVPVGPFAASYPLTAAGDVWLVPTPGHSRGHQSVLLTPSGGPTVCLAGDATFSEAQLLSGEQAGICEDAGDAARSAAVLRDLVADQPTVYLPSHDAGAASRLRALQPTAPAP